VESRNWYGQSDAEYNGNYGEQDVVYDILDVEHHEDRIEFYWLDGWCFEEQVKLTEPALRYAVAEKRKATYTEAVYQDHNMEQKIDTAQWQRFQQNRGRYADDKSK